MQEILLKAMKIVPQENELEIEKRELSKSLKSFELSKNNNNNTFFQNSATMNKTKDKFSFKKIKDHSQVQEDVINHLINKIEYEKKNNDSPRLRFKIKPDRLITLSVE